MAHHTQKFAYSHGRDFPATQCAMSTCVHPDYLWNSISMFEEEMITDELVDRSTTDSPLQPEGRVDHASFRTERPN